MSVKRTLIFTLTASINICAVAQKTPPFTDWYLKDPSLDHTPGASIEKAYDSLLKGRPSKTVIVAVLDGGVDIEHEDLKAVIWKNPGEIEGNGIDDDHNGYIDDIHGWNFIGGKEGNVKEDTYEITREYVRLRDKFADMDEKKIPKADKKDYVHYLDLKSKFEKRKAKEADEYDLAKQQYRLYQNIEKNILFSIDTLTVVLKKDKLTVHDVENFKPSEPALLFSKGLLMRMLKSTEKNDLDSLQMEISSTVSYFKSLVDYYSTIVDYGYNEEFNSRLIVGDSVQNFLQKYYGNNDVKGPDAEHGTHVAGTIAADRKNEIGIKGIADNVRIMPVRVVPNGDERDKDVANGIRYAADNGARIINMSFGKSYSPQKKVVDDAVKYAIGKGVLLIHASGNDNQDIEKNPDYPNRYFLDGTQAKGWLEVGASTWNADENFVADFSNYGKKTVDLFSPGKEIYATIPDNEYKNLNGTSMAAPIVSGVAAMLMSYFPDLTAVQVADIIKKSTRKFDGLKVKRPGGGKVNFSELSNTGGLINAFDAARMALAFRPAGPESK